MPNTVGSINCDGAGAKVAAAPLLPAEAPGDWPSVNAGAEDAGGGTCAVMATGADVDVSGVETAGAGAGAATAGAGAGPD